MIIMKKLGQFIKSKNLTIREFCAKNNLHYPSIRVLLYGKYRPSPDVAERIEYATGGKISRLDLLYPKNGKRKAA